MARIIKFFKTVRTHWKKSTFLAIALAYGTNYTIEHFQTHELMRTYCLEAKRFGDEKIPDGSDPKNITVILNPTANRRKAAKQFDKYCAPILHLAGFCVDILQTESEGHARKLIENLKNTDAIIIAGGDGTVSEVITGLFRRSGDDRYTHPCPIGILPLGQTNSVGRVLFPGGETLSTVKTLADASMAIVKENIKLVDVMKVEIIKNEIENNNASIKDDSNKNVAESKSETIKETKQESETPEKVEVPENTQIEIKTPEDPKPIYALASLEWGAFRDAYAKQDKYWYWGSLRKYATYIFNGYKKSLTWECNAQINYLEPCEGCSNCYVKEKAKSTRWWSRLWSRPIVEKDFSKVVNERCGTKHTKDVLTTDFQLKTTNVVGVNEPKLFLNIGPNETKYLDFVKEGFKTLNGEDRSFQDKIQARQIELLPKNINDKEIWFSIDKEEYEAMPVRITLLPRVLKVFCKNDQS